MQKHQVNRRFTFRDEGREAPCEEGTRSRAGAAERGVGNDEGARGCAAWDAEGSAQSACGMPWPGGDRGAGASVGPRPRSRLRPPPALGTVLGAILARHRNRALTMARSQPPGSTRHGRGCQHYVDFGRDIICQGAKMFSSCISQICCFILYGIPLSVPGPTFPLKNSVGPRFRGGLRPRQLSILHREDSLTVKDAIQPR